MFETSAKANNLRHRGFGLSSWRGRQNIIGKTLTKSETNADGCV